MSYRPRPLVRRHVGKSVMALFYMCAKCFCAVFSIEPQIYRNYQTIANQNMQYIINTRSTEHCSFHTANKTFFLQNKPYLTSFDEQSQSIWQADQQTNIPKTSGSETCARRSPSYGLANPAIHTSLVSTTH
jgi:hypothetical protein